MRDNKPCKWPDCELAARPRRALTGSDPDFCAEHQALSRYQSQRTAAASYASRHPEWAAATQRRKDANKRGPSDALWRATWQNSELTACWACGVDVRRDLHQPRLGDADLAAPWLIFRREPRDAGPEPLSPENLAIAHVGCVPGRIRQEARQAGEAWSAALHGRPPASIVVGPNGALLTTKPHA
jgi:hypothetical protein